MYILIVLNIKKENGRKDNGIDIIAKKEKEILFIQCKNWSANSTRKVKADDIKIARQNIDDFLEKNPLYKLGGYKIKIIYAISENVLHGSAYHYIQDNSDVVEFRIIPMID
ncbi:restriction endonuclease [Sulfurimonas sp.]|uniref:restriction endonuclease n=1 Tax=Sulfurimonas sp. TaxID=2022749 RepID=UPI002B49ED46|nr:restriction endonuclease [Sulfurimonas sp.]